MGKKGKAQGRAGQKKKAQKTTPTRSKAWAQPPWLDDDDDSPRLFKGFTQSSMTSSPRNTALKLRHQTISFVSAGSNTPAEPDSQPSLSAPEIAMLDTESQEDASSSEEDVEEEFDDSTLQTNILEVTGSSPPQGELAQLHIHSTSDVQGHSDSPPNGEGGRSTALHDTGAHDAAETFFVDTIGDPALSGVTSSNGNKPIVRKASPTPSDASGEMVTFRGRNRLTVVDESVTYRSGRISTPLPSTEEAPHVTDSLLAALSQPLPPQSEQPTARGWATRPSAFQTPSEQSNDVWTPSSGPEPWKRKSRKPRPDLDPSPADRKLIEAMPMTKPKVAFAEPRDENVTAEDTIAVLQAEIVENPRGKKSTKTNARQTVDDYLGLGTNAGNRKSKRGRRKDNRQLKKAALLNDDGSDSEAAYDDYMANLASQLDDTLGTGEALDLSTMRTFAESAFLGGPSLVVNGKVIAENEVLDPKASAGESVDEDDDSSESEGPIGEDRSQISDDDAQNWSDLDSSEQEERLEQIERQEWEDEADLRQRRHDRMTDEHIARLLQKQQDIGIDGDELVLDDGEYMSDELDGVGDVSRAYAGVANVKVGGSSRRNGAGRSRSNGNGGLTFPSASALADTLDLYGDRNGFDIMDFDRPSLRVTKKGRKGKVPEVLESLSDDELKAGMTETWENDRNKKRLRKMEREELRAQGLLGAAGRNGKADLSQKYLEGMNMKQIQDELRIFLSNDGQTSRAFPPMDKRDRKALHEIAGAFSLKSKSVGSGKNRFPVLYKTSFTAEYSDIDFQRVASRGFLRNSAGKGNKFPKKAARPGAGGGFSAAATGLRNGEIVGAGAAEIGKENFGHRLMEKMGWSKGMALGKDGEGRLVPVEQVMRAGKAGLG